MTENTRRYLKVEQVLGEWAVVAYATPNPEPRTNDGLVWLRGFANEGQAKLMRDRLAEAMKDANKKIANGFEGLIY